MMKYRWAEVKAWEGDVLHAVASTGTLDRQGEIIDLAAWQRDLPDYRRNPVILAAHQHRLTAGNSPVIGSASQIDVQGGSLNFRMTFAQTDLAKEYASLYRDGHMRAFSVGFIPVEGEWRDMDTAAGKARVYAHKRVELIEISAVAVPANTDALVRMLEAAQGPAAPTEDELAERKALDKIIAGLPAEIGAFERQIEGTLGELRELIVGLLPGTAVESPAEEDPPRGADRRASAAGEDGDPLRRSAAALRRAIGH